MTALEKIKDITAFLQKSEIIDVNKEAEMILTRSLNIDRVKLYRDNPELSESNLVEIDKILERRAKREPLQYILGYEEFYGITIKVGPGVLVPRPETEMIVEEVLKKFKVQSSKFKVLDLCTGSGCLALAIAKHIPNSIVYGTDISKAAIGYARENAEANNIRNVTFFKGSLFEPVERFAPFDIIVSNPPYIKTNDITSLQPEISKWEPRNALDGGEDGLRFFNEILSAAPKYIVERGFMCLELGQGQADRVAEVARRNNFRIISIMRDCLDIERIISMTYSL